MSLRFGSIGGWRHRNRLLVDRPVSSMPSSYLPTSSGSPCHRQMFSNTTVSPLASLNLVEQVFGIATVALLIIVITRAGTKAATALPAGLRSRPCNERDCALADSLFASGNSVRGGSGRNGNRDSTRSD